MSGLVGKTTLNDLTFRVELWDEAGNRILELIAACDSLLVAEGAYKAAVQMRRPDANLTLRHGARVVRKTRD